MGLIKKIKENVMPVLGIGVAIGLSAWSLTSEGMEEGKKAETSIEQTEPALYWYEVDLANGTIGSQVNSSPQTKSESMPSGTNPITECEDEATTLCLVGFSSPQSANTPIPSNPDADHSIRKSQN